MTVGITEQCTACLYDEKGVILHNIGIMDAGPIGFPPSNKHVAVYGKTFFVMIEIKNKKLVEIFWSSYDGVIAQRYVLMSENSYYDLYTLKSHYDGMSFRTKVNSRMIRKPYQVFECCRSLNGKEIYYVNNGRSGRTAHHNKDHIIYEMGNYNTTIKFNGAAHIKEVNGSLYIMSKNSIQRVSDKGRQLSQIKTQLLAGMFRKNVSYNATEDVLCIAAMKRSGFYVINNGVNDVATFEIGLAIKYTGTVFVGQWERLRVLFIARYKSECGVWRPVVMPLDIFKTLCFLILKKTLDIYLSEFE